MVTNLGDVPEGMTFLQATFAAGPQRKYRINPQHRSGRLTACETCREIWRIAETLPEPARAQMQELAGQAYDMAKRMNGRMVELRGMVEGLGGKP
jgi:hypothetical protein